MSTTTTDSSVALTTMATTAVVGFGILLVMMKKRSASTVSDVDKDKKSSTSKVSPSSSSSAELPSPKDGPTFQEYFSTMTGGKLVDKQQEWFKAYGSIFMIPSPLKGVIPTFCVISDPKITKELTIKHTNQNRPPYSFQTRTDVFAKATRESVGASLAGTTGSEWKWRRTAFLKEMHKSKLFNSDRKLLHEMYTIGESKLCNQLEEAVISGETIQVDIIATEAAMDTILFFLFGKVLKEGYNADDVRQAAKDTLAYMLASLMDPLFQIKKYIPGTSSYKALQKRNDAWNVFDSIVKDEISIMINEAKGIVTVDKERHPGSILESWLKNEPKFYERNLDPILAEVRGMILAGFETTAHAIAYSMGMMAERPDLANKLYDISTKALKTYKSNNNNNTPDTTDGLLKLLDDTQYVKNFFMEALRLYPLAPALGGECTQDIEITVDRPETQKFTLPKGTNALFFNFAMQRNPDYLDEPNEINPDRWDKSSPEQLPFLHTFNNGPHACPGKPLSLLEGQVFLTQIASKFIFEFPPDVSRVLYDENMLLRPKDAMPLIVKKR